MPRYGILLCAAASIRGFVTQVEAHTDLGQYRQADTALAAAMQKDPSFAATNEYRSLATQLTTYLQRQGKQ